MLCRTKKREPYQRFLTYMQSFDWKKFLQRVEHFDIYNLNLLERLLTFNGRQRYQFEIYIRTRIFKEKRHCHVLPLQSQNKEGILPVVTLSIALYVPRRSRSDSDVAPEMAILFSAL